MLLRQVLCCSLCLLCVLSQGTHVTSGRCRAVVVGTGTSTAIGRIRDAMVASQVSLCRDIYGVDIHALNLSASVGCEM
jgi:magnesium-transporting ATPase (P-type)